MNIKSIINFLNPTIICIIFIIFDNIGFMNIYTFIYSCKNLCNIKYILTISIILNIMFIFILSKKFVFSITFEKK